MTDNQATTIPRSADPLIKMLIDRLPEPGCYWEDKDRKYWLQAMEAVFGLVYMDDDA